MNKRFTIAVISLIFCLNFLSGCRPDSKQTPPPQIKDGVLDLRNWNLDEDGSVELSGSWLFYWNQLLTEMDVSEAGSLEQTGLYQVPSTWNGYRIDGKPLGGDGFATLVLEVLIQPRDTPLAFKIQDMNTAYNLYVDHQPVASNGIVGISRDTMTPEFRPLTASFTVSGDRFRIILQISNFHHRRGGPWSAIKMGSEKKIEAEAMEKLLTNGFLIGSIFIMGLYHLFMFILRRKEFSYLYFGFFCSLIALRSLLVSERYLHIFFPGLSWEFLQKLEYLCFYLAVPIFAMFIASIFPDDFKTRALRLIQLVSVLFSLVVVFATARTFTATVNAYQVFTIASGLYLFFVLFKAYRHHREGIIIIVGGYLFLFITIINEILFVNGVIQTGYTIPLGMFVFIFSQAFMLSQRYTMAFAEIENQKRKLIGTNIAYKEEIENRQILERKLRKSLQDFQDSRFALILGLAKLAEYRDEDTGSHLERMREYVKTLAKELAHGEKYRDYITDEYILDIYHSSILHDIGKVGIKDAILLKPGKLTQDEFEVMKCHSRIGGDAILAVETKIQVQSFLSLGRQIAYHHHEKWNGTGYPGELKGDEIPLSAQITALADVYDALTSVRPYKKAFSHEKAAAIIFGDSGTHFAPDVVEAFRAQEKMFDKIRAYLGD
ncbi:MAG: 7TM diverse intracellular signaling domain-containing protein [bacterium]